MMIVMTRMKSNRSNRLNTNKTKKKNSNYWANLLQRKGECKFKFKTMITIKLITHPITDLSWIILMAELINKCMITMTIRMIKKIKKLIRMSNKLLMMTTQTKMTAVKHRKEMRTKLWRTSDWTFIQMKSLKARTQISVLNPLTKTYPIYWSKGLSQARISPTSGLWEIVIVKKLKWVYQSVSLLIRQVTVILILNSVCLGNWQRQKSIWAIKKSLRKARVIN